MKHIVTVTLNYLVDDSQLVDWEDPETHVKKKIEQLDIPQTYLIGSVSKATEYHGEDPELNIRSDWQKIKDKYTKKSLFTD